MLPLNEGIHPMKSLWQSLQQLPSWVLLSVGAILGVLLRYHLVRFFSVDWVGILSINLIGCFGFGVGLGLILVDPERFDNHAFRLFYLTGMMGAMTTFSSYLFNLHQFIQASPQPAWGALCFNVCVQHGLGLALMALTTWGIPPLYRLGRSWI
jgi:fluoride ion exporter CrcB/FEX